MIRERARLSDTATITNNEHCAPYIWTFLIRLKELRYFSSLPYRNRALSLTQLVLSINVGAECSCEIFLEERR